MKEENPWLYETWDGLWVQPCTVPDRIEVLKRFDPDRLQAAIGYSGTQKTVRLAAERMLRRKLNKKTL